MENSIRSRDGLSDEASGLGQTIRSYLELTKVRIVLLLIFTTVTAMFIAADGLPQFAAVLPTVLGGAMSAAGASVMNQFLDRDLDAKMSRTARRPIPTGRIAPINALLFGLTLIVWSTLILGYFVNWLTALLALSGALYYVVIYTMMLKRNTAINIVIGGGAGAMPVLVGWAAVTGSLNYEAFILFAIIFFWTPPHSWALALLVNTDYARAGVPMMPVARGEATTRRQIVIYALVLIAVSVLPFFTDTLSVLYLFAAVALGGGLLWWSIELLKRKDGATAKRTYKYSTAYLAFLFLAMILDRVLM
jgi:protoheme IX farnesyltransferase